MALNVVSNYAARVAQRYLNKATVEAACSIAKLASGTRVLTARDDPASMAIGTKMRSEMAGLKQAALNVGQAASMLQVADSAMAGIGVILLRMKTLAVQAASDQVDASGRALIQTEFVQLMGEIDRISGATAFGGQKLIDRPKSLVFGIGSLDSAADRQISITFPEANAGSLGLKSDYTYVSGTFDYNQALAGARAAGGWLLTVESEAEKNLVKARLSSLGVSGNVWMAISDSDVEGVWRYTDGPNLGQEIFYSAWRDATQGNNPGEDFAWLSVGSDGTGRDLFADGTWGDAAAGDLNSQQGYVIEKTSSTAVSLATQAAAASAINVVSGAISQLVSMRATLGAAQNRLEVAGTFIARQLVDVEAARSGLIDLDVASELAAFAASQVLQEAGASMLAQANRLPQGLLKLLQ